METQTLDPASQATASINTIKGLLAAAERCGAARAPLLGAIALSAADLRDDSARVPLKRLAVLDVALRTTLGRTAGLRLGDAVAKDHATIVGYLCDCARTLRELFELLTRYRSLTLELPLPRLEVRGGLASFEVQYPDDLRDVLPLTIECELASWLAKVRKVSGPRWAPSHVAVQCTDADNRAEYEELLGAAVRFGAGATGFAFEARWLDLPLPAGDGALLARLQPIADDILRSLVENGSFVKRVRTALERSLASGGSSVEDVARALAVSPRTLQRRLEKEGTTFGEICDETRRAAALEHLRNARLGIKETAFRLGFSEPSTFYRAFRRWTGDTPANYRRAFAVSAA
jgi:AraC-like DNA-binding protein